MVNSFTTKSNLACFNKIDIETFVHVSVKPFKSFTGGLISKGWCYHKSPSVSSSLLLKAALNWQLQVAPIISNGEKDYR